MSDTRVVDVATTPFTEAEARHLVNKINAGISAVGEMLLELYEREGWRALGYSSWRECVMAELDFQQSRVYQLLDFAQITRTLSNSTIGGKIPLPQTERQARPLTRLPAEDQPTAWQQAVDTAPNGKVTAAHVEETVQTFNYKRDNKANREGDIYTPKGYDLCQTPAYALDPLLPYLTEFTTIWEPARGEGYLEAALYDAGFDVIPTDIQTGQNYFEFEPGRSWDCSVTNPPYSIKYKWIERCYELGKPFALLMPVETLGAKSAQRFFKEYGLEIIFLDRRVNFKMPNKGWDSSAQFPVAWFTWGLNIGEQMTFAKIESNDI